MELKNFHDYLDYLNLQAEEIHEDNIRWNAQMAGVDMVQSTRQQGSQEVIYHCQTEYLLDDSRKYPYPSTGGISILTPPPRPPCLVKLQNALPLCPPNFKITNPPFGWISLFYFNHLES